MPSEHAILSPSASSRWLMCPGSVRATEHIEAASSSFADEGTCAHSLCEALINQYTHKINCTDQIKSIMENPYYNADMQGYCEDYAAKVIGRCNELRAVFGYAVLGVEFRVSMEKWAPDCWGTSDAIIACKDILEVYDFKYGQGIRVDAFRNPQMMLYALGAYEVVEPMFTGIKTVNLNIYQPRINNFSTFTMGLDELLAWGQSIIPVAKKAYNGEKDFHAGDHCRWCAIRETCRTRAEKALSLRPTKKVEELSMTEITAILPLMDFLKQWAVDVWAYAENKLLDGGTVPGYKLVHGRSSRVMDADAVKTALEAEKLPREKYLSEPALLGITALEKNIGKEKFASLCGAFVTKVDGKLKMAPESDKRPEVTKAENALEELLGG